jgi:hypothetical protein
MRIIETDNFDRDYPNEEDIAIRIKSLRHADIMCKALNAATGEYAVRFYRVVTDDYVLRPGDVP